MGRGRGPPRVAQPRHRVDVGPRLQRRGRVGRPPRAAHRPGHARAPPRARASDARAPAAPVLRLAVPDHDGHCVRLRRATHRRALCRVQATLRDGARARSRRHPLVRRGGRAPAARARGLLLPGPRPGVGSGRARGALSPMPRRARLLAMIMAGGRGDRLQPLTRERSKSAVPFGGRHRLIDFVLSNFMNSDMPSLYVLVQYKAQSLIEHLRLAWRTSGLLPDFFVTVVPPQMRVGVAWYRGTADAVLQNLNLIEDFNADAAAAETGRWPERAFACSVTAEWIAPGLIFPNPSKGNGGWGVKPSKERAYGRVGGRTPAYWEAHRPLLGEPPRFALDNRLWPI